VGFRLRIERITRLVESLNHQLLKFELGSSCFALVMALNLFMNGKNDEMIMDECGVCAYKNEDERMSKLL
jgi:hypothetical protein